MKVHCTHDQLVSIEELKPNPRNPNQHPQAQLELLAKILKHQGWRQTIVVSKESGHIVRGHGRLEAARLAGFTEAPVDYQSYEDVRMEYADMIADNRIAELADMSNSQLKNLIEELDAGDFDLDLTGYDSPSLELLMSQYWQGEEGATNNQDEEWSNMPEFVEGEKSHRRIVVNFASADDVNKFVCKLGLDKFTEKTISMWYPWHDRQEMPYIE